MRLLTLLVLFLFPSLASAQAALVQPLFSGSSKVAGSTLVLSGLAGVASGLDIFVAFAADAGGAPYVVSDNLGNAYVIQEVTTHPGTMQAMLFRAASVPGGALTSIIIAGSNSVAAKAAVSGAFSGVGFGTAGNGGIANGGVAYFIGAVNRVMLPPSGIGIGAAAFERAGTAVIQPYPGGLVPVTPVIVGQAGTIGGGERTNITVALLFATTPTGTQGYQGVAVIPFGRTHASAGAGGVYWSQ